MNTQNAAQSVNVSDLLKLAARWEQLAAHQINRSFDRDFTPQQAEAFASSAHEIQECAKELRAALETE